MIYTNARGHTAKRYVAPSCACCNVMGAFWEETVTGFLYCDTCWHGCGDTCQFKVEVLA